MAAKKKKSLNIKLDEGAYLPERAHSDDAGMDLRTPEPFTIIAGSSATIDTGVHMEIPSGYFGKLESKSGLNVKKGVVCLGGVIDASYRGSIVVKLYNQSYENHTFNKGDKIVQLIIQPCELMEANQVEELSNTERGENGFGSTGR